MRIIVHSSASGKRDTMARLPKFNRKSTFFTKKCKSGFSFSDTAVALSHKLNGLPLTFGTPKVVRLECVDYVAVSENNGQF